MANTSAPIRAHLAVTAKIDEAVAEYRRKFTLIFRECWRVLYHHKSAKA